MPYVRGTRVRTRTYRFAFTAGADADDALYVMSRMGRVITPSDCKLSQTGQMVEMELTQDVPVAGGMVDIYAFIPKSTKPPAPP